MTLAHSDMRSLLRQVGKNVAGIFPKFLAQNAMKIIEIIEIIEKCKNTKSFEQEVISALQKLLDFTGVP